MKKILILLLCLLMIIGFVGCSTNTSTTKENTQTEQTSTDVTQEKTKSIVIYFSRTNNTEKIANYIVDITDSDKYEIEAKVPYTDADINYSDSNSRTTKEQNDPTSRPEIGSKTIDLSEYDIIYLGYPIWWGQAPKIMYTFIESYNFAGKTIIPFCTSGSSGIGTSAINLSKTNTTGIWKEGKRFSSSSSKNEVELWINSLN